MQNIPSVFLFLYSTLRVGGAQLQPTIHIIPEGTESVNGSDVNGGCLSPLSFVRSCGNLGSGTISYLIDDIIPVLNTAVPNWASQLVTVRKNSPTVAIPYDHVLLLFDFSLRMSLIVVDLYLFSCPEWNIGAPNITVYVDEDGGNHLNYAQGTPGIAVRGNVLFSQSSCDSLLPVRIPLENISAQYYTWYIVVSFEPQPDIEWIHIGEIQVFDTEPPPLPVPITDITPTLNASASTMTRGSFSGHAVCPTVTSTANTCSSEESGHPALTAVSAVSILLVILLLTVVVVQCCVIGRMRRSLLIMANTPQNTSTSHGTIPVAENEAYGLQKRTTAQQEAVYECVQDTHDTVV